MITAALAGFKLSSIQNSQSVIIQKPCKQRTFHTVRWQLYYQTIRRCNVMQGASLLRHLVFSLSGKLLKINRHPAFVFHSSTKSVKLYEIILLSFVLIEWVGLVAQTVDYYLQMMRTTRDLKFAIFVNFTYFPYQNLIICNRGRSQFTLTR